ncbi:MAG: hypothetical protein ACXW5U_04560 [Thermoanaerobaculia bacterium]
MTANRPNGDLYRTRLLLILLLGVQLAIMLAAPWPRDLVGDETSFFDKAAALATTGALPRARANEIDIMEGRVRGNTDYRPVGYPVLLAGLSGLRVALPWTHRIAAIAQFAAMGAALLLIHSVIWRVAGNRKVVWLMTALLGLQPWTFEYVRSLLPDSFTASITTIALVLLIRYVQTHSLSSLVWGTVVLSSTLLLRAEMVALAAFTIAAVVFASRSPFRKLVLHGAVASLAFAAVLSIQVGYRWWFIGQPGLYGPLRGTDEGAYAWAYTWVNTERTLFFIWTMKEGRVAIEDVPARAFDTAVERERVARAFEITRREGRLVPEADEILGAVAAERVARSPIRNWLVPRIVRSSLLWFNRETNSQLLGVLAYVPHPVRRPLLAILLALRVSTILLGIVGVTIVLRDALPRGAREYRLAALPFAVFVILRTAYVGGVHGSMEHRYMLNAWPAMLVCATVAMDWIWSRWIGRQAPRG